MQNLKSLWKKTQRKFNSLEKELVDCYISFLREAAKYYLQQGRRVFFQENRVVHWGEGYTEIKNKNLKDIKYEI